MFIFSWDVESHPNDTSRAVQLSLSTGCVKNMHFMLRLPSAALFTPRALVQILVEEELSQMPKICTGLPFVLLSIQKGKFLSLKRGVFLPHSTLTFKKILPLFKIPYVRH